MQDKHLKENLSLSPNRYVVPYNQDTIDPDPSSLSNLIDYLIWNLEIGKGRKRPTSEKNLQNLGKKEDRLKKRSS